MNQKKKYALAGGGYCLYAPRFPRFQDAPGFADEACIGNALVPSVFFLSFLENGRPLQLNHRSTQVDDGRATVEWLASLGAPFDREADGGFLVSREAAHSMARVARVGGDGAGRAILSALVYSFVRAMTAISAVIFLVSAQYDMATTYIIGRVENNEYGVAIAYATVLIFVMLIAMGLFQWIVGTRRLGRRGMGQNLSMIAGGS
jgi:hypothetical protein